MSEKDFDKLCEALEQAIEHARGERDCKTYEVEEQ